MIPALKPLYDYAWFVGFFVAGAVHVALATSSSDAVDRRALRGAGS